MDEIQEPVMQTTNLIGTTLYGENCKAVDNIELMAWICLPIRARLDKDGLRPVDELFSTMMLQPIYRASMRRNKFNELKTCLIFDDMSTREVRKTCEQ